MRDTALTACDFSANVLRRLPPQFPFKFSTITGKLKFIYWILTFGDWFGFNPLPDLNLSKNEIYKLPEEFAEMKELVRLDVSHNYLLNLPSVLFRIPKLRQLRANHNAIIGRWNSFLFNFNFLFSFHFLTPHSDIESDRDIASKTLEFVDLRSNPLTPQCYKLLKNAQVSFHIELSERRIKEDWEDLTI